jgi:hypothetical protein
MSRRKLPFKLPRIGTTPDQALRFDSPLCGRVSGAQVASHDAASRGHRN